MEELSDTSLGATLPSDVLLLVLSKLGGDVKALCAASCVSKAWNAAASRPEAWRVIRVKSDGAPSPLARKLTDSRLVQLLSRCVEATPGVGTTRQRHHLSSLTLDRCALVTDAGLAPLRAGRRLRYLNLVGCTLVTLASLVETLCAALGKKKLRKLAVNGLAWQRRGFERRTHEDRGATGAQLQQLRTLLAHPDALDVRERCVGTISRPCLTFVRKVEHACGGCPGTVCKWCAHRSEGRVMSCCGNYECGECLDGYFDDGEDDACPVCNPEGFDDAFYSDEELSDEYEM